MNRIVRQVLGEHEIEGGKLRPEAVMYLNPEQVANAEGCRCGRCIFFTHSSSECQLTTPPACDADHGVCGLYFGGPSTLTSITPQNRIPKSAAGYVTDGPSHCANCEYFIQEGEGGCQKVGGYIHAKGCCSHWESGDKAEDDVVADQVKGVVGDDAEPDA